MEITSSQIVSAYVGQIGSGNLTLSKQHGTNYDHFNVGIFTLGNGKTAFVVSSNSTDLIIQLDNGEYVYLVHGYFAQVFHRRFTSCKHLTS